MAKEGEKPGVLEGLAKEFFSGVPYAPPLTRSEQIVKGTLQCNDLARRQLTELHGLERGQREEARTSQRLLQESTRATDIAERTLAPLLRDITSGNAINSAETHRRLADLKDSFEAGSERIASTVQDVGEASIGIPTDRRSVEELLSSGVVDEAELIILASSRILARDQMENLWSALPAWKIDVIRSGLVTRIDPKAEKALSSQQKVFLAQLRRKVASSPADFRSLTVCARHGLIDREVHHALAEKLPQVRFGIEGIQYGVRDINDGVRDLGSKASILVDQGDALIARGNTQISIGRQGLAFDAVKVTQGAMALRLMKAGILKTEELVDVGRESVQLQRSSLDIGRASLDVNRASLDVSRASLDIQKRISGGIDSLGDLAQRAEIDRGEIRENTALTASSTLEIARHTGEALRFAARAEVDRRGILEGIDDLNDATRYFGGLQALQMGEAQETRLEQTRLIGALVEIGQSNQDVLGEIERRMDVLREVGVAQIEATGQVVDAIDSLREGISGGLEKVIETLIAIDERSDSRSRNRDQIAASESFDKAIAMLKIGKIDKAIKYFDESEDRWPADFRVYFQRGLCHVLKENSGLAESDFSDAVKLAGGEGQERTRALIRLNLARLYYSEANVHFKNGRQDEYEERLLKAIEEAQDAVVEDPYFLEASFDLAVYLAAFKLLDEALKILLSLARKDPSLLNKFPYFEALAPFKGILKNTLGENLGEPDKNIVSKTHLSIAKDCVAMGDFETALSCIEFLLKKDPGYLNGQKLWRMAEFQILLEPIVQLIKGLIINMDNYSTESCYAILGIVSHYPNFGRGRLYKILKSAIENDKDFKSGNAQKVLEKIRFNTDDKAELILQTAKLIYPADLPDWLTKLF